MINFGKKVTIIFKPTFNCNLNCSYCYERNQNHNYIMPKEQMIQIIQTLLDTCENTLSIIWHGGEPTVVGLDYFKDVINHFKSTNRITWNVQSNGILLDDDWLQFYKENNIQISTSWDGINNDMSRGRNNFIRLVKLAKKYEIPVHAIMTVTPQNAKDVMDTWTIATELSVGVMFNAAFGIGINEIQSAQIAKSLNEVFDRMCITENAHIIRPFDDVLNYLIGTPGFWCETINCTEAWFGVWPNGDVYPCAKPWGQGMKCGNLLTDNPEEVLSKTNPVKQRLLEVRLQQMSDCKDCDYLLSCYGKCPYTGFRSDNSYQKDEAQCVFNKEIFNGCLDIIEQRLLNNSLINWEVIDAVRNSTKTRFIKWKNYKSPLT